MLTNIIVAIVALVIGVIGGIFIGRNNAAKIQAAISKAEAIKDAAK